MSAFQQRKQLLRRHIQDPGLLAAGYRIKKRKLPVLKLQNSFFDGVLCNQLIDLHVCLLADAVGTVRRLILRRLVPPWVVVDHNVGCRQIPVPPAFREIRKTEALPALNALTIAARFSLGVEP